MCQLVILETISGAQNGSTAAISTVARALGELSGAITTTSNERLAELAAAAWQAFHNPKPNAKKWEVINELLEAVGLGCRAKPRRERGNTYKHPLHKVWQLRSRRGLSVAVDDDSARIITKPGEGN